MKLVNLLYTSCALLLTGCITFDKMPDVKPVMNVSAVNDNDKLPVVVTSRAEQNQLGVDITVRFPSNWFVNTGSREGLIVGTGRFSGTLDTTSFELFAQRSALVSVRSVQIADFKGRIGDIIAQCKLPDFKQRGFKITGDQKFVYKPTRVDGYPAVMFNLPREKKQNGVVPSSLGNLLVSCVGRQVVQFVCVYSAFADHKKLVQDEVVREFDDFCNLVYGNVSIADS